MRPRENNADEKDDPLSAGAIDDDESDDAAAPFDVWRENDRVSAVFLRCRTQWRRGAMGGFEGFDYAGVEIVMSRMRVKSKNATFELLQVMELAALPILNRKQDV